MTYGAVEDLYTLDILRLAAAITRTERLAAPDATVTVTSPVCGSRISVDVRLEDDVVADYGHAVHACALGQAAASVMARHVVGRSADELRQVAARMRAMLEAGGPPPDGRWAELGALQAVHTFKPRHAAVMLPFDAVLAAIAEVTARQCG